MTPSEYRDFCESTYCAPPGVNRDEYLRLLLIEEVGEVASLFAKSMRDGHEVDRDRLKKELGDVLWASEMHKHDWDEPHYHSRHPHDWYVQDNDPYDDTIDLLCRIGSEDEEYIDVRALCWSCGFSPAEVAVANVAKLQDRQARGVLHGAGDER